MMGNDARSESTYRTDSTQQNTNNDRMYNDRNYNGRTYNNNANRSWSDTTYGGEYHP